MEQRTPEWVEARIGKVTSSRVSDIMATTKSGPAASRKNYMAEKVAERLTGVAAEHFVSKEMQWGTEQEDIARAEYEIRTGTFVDQVGFVDHPIIAMCGGSPDGLVGDEGLIEIKCPNTATHIAFLLGSPIDKGYWWQMQWNMACTKRKWCDFVSFDPRMPENMQLKIVRIPRDDAFIMKAEAEIKTFLSELDRMIEQLLNMGSEE